MISNGFLFFNVQSYLNIFQQQEIQQLENNFKEYKLQLIEQINELKREKNELNQSIYQQEEIFSETKLKLNTIEKEKDDLEIQVETKQQTMTELQLRISGLCTELDRKVRKTKQRKQ